jgi:serine/threonine-protein kinase
MDAVPDTLIDGKYRIVRSLGEGGMGVVFIAEHTFLKKNVALKFLRPELARQPEVAARFEQEARATSLIDHENVVRVMDFGRTPAGELYLVMELLEGHSLSVDLQASGALGPERALPVAKQVLAGLAAAHQKGVVHRDLKPDNILVVSREDGGELCKIVDFGIAKLQHETSLHLTATGTVMGTPLYMAPEQARGEASLDHRVDVYSLGVMLYEMLAGSPPFEGQTYNTVIFEILTGAPPHLSKRAPHLPAMLCDAVMKAMALRRDDRYGSAREFREGLEACEGKGAKPPLPRVPRGPWDAGAALPATLELVGLDGAPDAPGADLLGPPPALTVAPLAASVEPTPVPRASIPALDAPQDPFAPPDAGDKALELAEPLARARTPRPRPIAPSRPARRGRLSGALAVGTLLVVAGAAAFVFFGPRLRGAASALSQDARVTITLEGAPDKAWIYLDEARTFANPLVLPRSEVTRVLSLECSGYTPRTLRFVPLTDQVLDVTMEEAAAPVEKPSPRGRSDRATSRRRPR